MRSSWQFVGFMFVLVLLHFVLHLALGYGRGAPDLLTVAVLLGARRLSGAGAAIYGFLLGLLADAVSLVAFGREAFAYAFVAFVGARSRELFVGDSLLFVAAYVFIGKWLHDAVFYAIAGAAARGDVVSSLLIQSPIGAVYAAAAAVALLLVYRGVSGER